MKKLKKQTVEELVQDFLEGAKEGFARNLTIVNGNMLVHYSTVIAIRTDRWNYLNGKKFSPTTSKIQNLIRNSGIEYKELTNIEFAKKMNFD